MGAILEFDVVDVVDVVVFKSGVVALRYIGYLVYVAC
jgi:hypothetical protein